jgi:hypothetical protein
MSSPNCRLESEERFQDGNAEEQGCGDHSRSRLTNMAQVIARRLASDGGRLMVVETDAGSLNTLVKELGGTTSPDCDIPDQSHLAALARTAVEMQKIDSASAMLGRGFDQRR